MYDLQHPDLITKEYKKKQKRKLNLFILSVAMMTIMLISAVVCRVWGGNINDNNYDELVSVVESTSYDDKILSYKKAIEIYPYDVEVYVIGKDRAGNETKTMPIILPIYTKTPTISVVAPELNKKDHIIYINNDTEIEVIITDNEATFDMDAATNSIKITGIDVDGKEITVPIKDWQHEEGTDKYSTTIYLSTEGKYNLEFDGYTNKAGKVIEESPNIANEFVIDKTAPGGVLIIGDKKWDSFRDKIIWGILGKEPVEVICEASDKLSDVKIEYYIHYYNSEEFITGYQHLSQEELDNKEFKELKNNRVYVDANSQWVIYARLTDSANNTAYICSDGYIIDNTPCSVVLDKDYESVLYNQDVQIKFSVIDNGVSSGINTVKCCIAKKGDDYSQIPKEMLYTCVDYMDNKQYEREISDLVITVDAEKYNSSNVIVYIEAVDNAGNVCSKEIPLDIDVIPPTINIVYDNNKDNHGNGCFVESRKATVIITERTNHFSADVAEKGIKIKAIKNDGTEIADIPTISGWTTTEGMTPDEATHTAEIWFESDANYIFSITYTDEVGNKAESKEHKFTIDKTAPSGSIVAKSFENEEKKWNELAKNLNFDFYSSKEIVIAGVATDDTSGIASVKYYIDNGDVVLTKEQLENVTSWAEYKEIRKNLDEKFTVYMQIKDNVGNTTYISTNGLIVDTKAPSKENLAPYISANPQTGSDVYNGDVRVNIAVEEPASGNAYSGLKLVSYKVFNMGTETQSGVLYTNNGGNANYSDLKKKWTGDIAVSSSLNNSNNIVVEVYAEDNAGNSDTYKLNLKIDVTEPTINIRYNNNTSVNEQYYNENRVATIVVTERNFDPDMVNTVITNADGVIPTIGNWVKSEGSGNGDNTTYTARITYSSDGDYTFDISCADMAGNKSTDVNYAAGTSNAKEFTIDKTLPVINVAYSNNLATNSKYFDRERTVIVTIREHNFDSNLVEIVQSAALNGTAITAPTISWSTNDDIHTAVIHYNADGDYTFDIRMSDLADNKSSEAGYGNSVAPKAFTIDKTIDEPEITGVENGVAYKDEVTPYIYFTDTNYSAYEIKLTRTVNGKKDEDVTETFIKNISVDKNGITSADNMLPMDLENDGIYTLFVKMYDKAGNVTEKTVKFTVNRFGSVYEYNEYLYEIIANGGAYVHDLKENLIITEYNADKILDDSVNIEITLDGKPLTEVIYEIKGEETVQGSNWFRNQYIISKDNFKNDGIYKISISSKDATGNMPENSNYEDKTILFRVDATAPEITGISGLENSIVNAQELTVSYNVYDTMGLKEIRVYIDGKLYGEPIVDFADDMNNYLGSIIISESDNPQNVRIVVEDLAGNITDTDAENFSSTYKFERNVTVSTNFFIRWYADKMLFWGSLGGVTVVIILSTILFVKRRKKGEAK